MRKSVLPLLLALTAIPLKAESYPSFFSDVFNNLSDSIKETATAFRTREEIKKTPAVCEVITKEEIKNSGVKTLKEVLARTAGIDMASSGEYGGASYIFLRGANSNNAVIMADGVKLYDPISPGGSFDIAFFPTENIERIEIIKGPQSSLYGSDAMAGIVNIITSKGTDKFALKTEFEGGANDYFRQNLSATGKTGKTAYSVSAWREQTAGISKAAAQYGNTEKDGYENTGSSLRLDFELSEKLNLFYSARYIKAKFDIDDSGGAGGDDINRTNQKEQFFTTAKTAFSPSDKYGASLSIFHSSEYRRDDDDNDISHPVDYLRSSYKGRNTGFDFQNILNVSEKNKFIFGIAYNKEAGSYSYKSLTEFGPYDTAFAEKSAQNTGFYFETKNEIADGKINISLSWRNDRRNGFEDKSTYKTGIVFLPAENVSLWANYGTGFRAPSLYQLYSAEGSVSLSPETSKSYEAGARAEFFDGIAAVSYCYFANSFRNLIDFDLFSWKYENIARANTFGDETEIEIKPIETAQIKFSAVSLSAKDAQNNTPLPRRARHKYAASAVINPVKKLTAEITVARYEGRYDVFGFPAQIISLPSYAKADISLSYTASDNLALSARAVNITNERYELVKGYGTLGRSLYFGFSLSV